MTVSFDFHLNMMIWTEIEMLEIHLNFENFTKIDINHAL